MILHLVWIVVFRIIPAFKKPPNQILPREQEEVFNMTALGKFRVVSEHVDGLLKKGQFPWQRCIPCFLTSNMKSMEQILSYINCCMILHNLVLVERKGHDNPEFWKYDNDDDNDDLSADIDDDHELNDVIIDYIGFNDGASWSRTWALLFAATMKLHQLVLSFYFIQLIRNFLLYSLNTHQSPNRSSS